MIIYIDTEIEINVATGSDYCAEQEELFKSCLKQNSVSFKREDAKYKIHAQKCCLPEYKAVDLLNALFIDAGECKFRFDERGEVSVRFNGYKTE